MRKRIECALIVAACVLSVSVLIIGIRNGYSWSSQKYALLYFNSMVAGLWFFLDRHFLNRKKQ